MNAQPSPNPKTEDRSAAVRARAFALIQERSFLRGQFVLASGKTSQYFLDMKPTMFDPEGSCVLAELLLDQLSDVKADYVGGLALGAVPLISTLTMLSHQRNRPVSGFFVRKEVKDHGTKKLVEGLRSGESLQGKKVVIIDDVTTTGGSSMIAVDAVLESGAEVILGLSVVDREQGAAETYGKRNIPFRAIFSARDFLAS
jgi:orotate phosphoribosyltransferase